MIAVIKNMRDSNPFRIDSTMDKVVINTIKIHPNTIKIRSNSNKTRPNANKTRPNAIKTRPNTNKMLSNTIRTIHRRSENGHTQHLPGKSKGSHPIWRAP